MVMYINFITTNGCIVSVVTINIVESLLIFILFYAQHTSFTMIDQKYCLFIFEGGQQSFWQYSYYFRIKTMFGSVLPQVVCRRADVLFVIYLCLHIVVSNTSWLSE